MKLGVRQRELLKKICESNGGGVYVDCCNEEVIRSLERRRLVQGKAGAQWCAVHTREGLELHRRLKDQP